MLTKEQELSLAKFAFDWNKAVSSCDPAARIQAAKAMTSIYGRLDREMPEIVWVDSPSAAVLKAIDLKLHRRNSLWDEMLLLFSANGFHISDDETKQIYRALKCHFLSNVFDSMLIPIDSVGMNYGYRRNGVQAVYTAREIFVHDELKLYNKEQTRRAMLADYEDLYRSLWYWWAYKDVCIMCERPEDLHIDSSGALHNPTGPAVVFRDGWKVFAVNGNMVDDPSKGATSPTTPPAMESNSEQAT